MNGETQKDTNEVILRGSIIRINKQKGLKRTVSEIRIAVEGKKGVSNYPLVTFFSDIPDDIKIRSNVTIKGHMQSTQSTDNKYVMQTRIIGDDISLTKRALSYVFPQIPYNNEVNGGKPDDMNMFRLIGKVTKVYSPAGKKNPVSVVRFTSKRNDMVLQCEVSCFQKQQKVAEMIEEGSKVAVTGYTSTSVKEYKGETRYFQNMIASDIYVLE